MSLSRTLIVSFIALFLFISGAQSSYMARSHSDNEPETKQVHHNTFHFGSGSSKKFSEATSLVFDDEVFQQSAPVAENTQPLFLFSSIAKAINDAINKAAREAQEAAERAAREQAERDRIAREKEAAFQKMISTAETDAKGPINAEWNSLHKAIQERLLAKQRDLELRRSNKPHRDFTLGEAQQPSAVANEEDESQTTVLSVFSLNRLRPASDAHVHDAETLAIFNEIEAAYQLTPHGQTAPEVIAPAMEKDAVAVIYEKCHFEGRKFIVKDIETSGNLDGSFGSVSVRKGYEIVSFSDNDFEGKKKIIAMNDDCIPAHVGLVRSFQVREVHVDNVMHDVLSQVL